MRAIKAPARRFGAPPALPGPRAKRPAGTQAAVGREPAKAGGALGPIKGLEGNAGPWGRACWSGPMGKGLAEALAAAGRGGLVGRGAAAPLAITKANHRPTPSSARSLRGFWGKAKPKRSSRPPKERASGFCLGDPAEVMGNGPPKGLAQLPQDPAVAQ